MLTRPSRAAPATWTLVVSVLEPTLLSGALSVATVLAGGVLAYRAHLKNRPALQTTAGLLLIAGFACLGVSISFIVGSALR